MKKIQLDPSDVLSSVYFCGILASLVPVVISSVLVPGFNRGGMYPIVTGVVYAVQAASLTFYYVMVKKVKVNKSVVLFAWLFSIPYLTTLLVTSLFFFEINKYDLINAFVRLMNVMLFLVFPFQLRVTKKGLIRFMYFVVVLGIVACIYNMAVNFRGMLNIFNIRNPYAVHFKSFYINRNSFAQLLFFGIIANTVLLFNKTRRTALLVYLLFSINLFATLSRTAIASAMIFAAVFVMLYSKKRVGLKFGALVLGFFVVATLLVVDFNSDFIRNFLIRPGAGLASRNLLWENGFRILDASSWLFGTGYLTGRELLTGSSQFHSFFVESLVGGGLIELCIFSFLFIFVLRNVRIIGLNDVVTGNVYLAGWTALFFYSLTESVSFFSMGYVDTIFTTFFITFPILYANSFGKVS